MTKRTLAVLACLMPLGLPSTTLAQRVGPEFRVNTYTTDNQWAPEVASNANGDFVVVWQSYVQDGSRWGIFGRRYDHDGNALGGEFQVNTFTPSDQYEPAVASDATGNFIVVWTRGVIADNDYDIFARRYDAEGAPLGGEFRVNTYRGTSSKPAVASDPDGNLIVVWASNLQDGENYGIFGQQIDRDGNRLGGEFQVSTYTKDSQTDPSLAVDANGNFVVVWTSGFGSDQDGSDDGVFGQRFDSAGNFLGEEFQVNTYTSGPQENPAVASDPSGNFVVAWSSEAPQDGSVGGIFAQRYDRTGNALGGEFQVNTYTTNWQVGPSVAVDAKGNFQVFWAGGGNQDGGGGGASAYGIFGQRYDSAGQRIGDEFQVNTFTDELQGDPSAASDASGNFVVVWYGNGDGDTRGVFGQRFASGCEASVQVQGDVNTAGTAVPVQVHIAHHRPKTVTVRWALTLLDASGEVVTMHISPPHTFAPGDVLDQEVRFQLPDDLASGEYTLDLAVKQMAGTKGARTTLRIVRGSGASLPNDAVREPTEEQSPLQ